MIKNLNDLLSFVVLILSTFICLRLFVWSLFKDDNHEDNDVNRWQLIKDYIDNIEE